MGLKKLTGKTTPALLAGTGIVTAIGTLTTLALVLIGLPSDVGQAVEATAADPHIVTAGWSETPAATVLTEALNAPPSGWSGQGGLQQLVTAPLPYSCPLAGAAPAVSLARAFDVPGSGRIQVITHAYTAGLGADAMARQGSNAAVCAGAETGLSRAGLPGPGMDARIATTSRGGVQASVVSFRRGDVIVHVTGSTSSPLVSLANAFDGILAQRLEGVCRNLRSTASEASRSPWSGSGYEPFLRAIKAAIPAVPLPADPTPSPSATTAVATPSASASASASPTATAPARVPIPSPDLVDRVVTPLPRPSYPVAPAMPEPVAKPSAPKAPAASATTESTLHVPSADPDGPGCGWAFTGMKALAFDEDAAAADRATKLAAARAKLEADAKSWQAGVLEYWAAYAKYKAEAEAYNAYAAKVTEVNKAWEAIGRTWDDYDDAVKDRDRKAAAQTAFLLRRDAARDAYEKDLARCEAASQPSPSASPTATATPQPTASASPTASPSPTVSPAPGCPAERPKILDEAAPEVPPVPVKPADPNG